MFYYKWISLSLICLIVTIILEIIAFSVNNWLYTINTTNTIRYGIWYVCSLSECSNWYTDSRLSSVTNYALNDSYRSFQAFQVIFLSLITIAFVYLSIVSIIFILKRINLFPHLIITALLVVGGAVAGTISIIVFGASVYDANLHKLDWCYWLSVAAVVLVLYSGISMIALAIRTNTLTEKDQQKYLNYSLQSASTLKTDRSKVSKEGTLDYKKLKSSTVNSKNVKHKGIQGSKPRSAIQAPVTSSIDYRNKNRIKSAPLPSALKQSTNKTFTNSSVQTSNLAYGTLQSNKNGTSRSRDKFKRLDRPNRSAKSADGTRYKQKKEPYLINNQRQSEQFNAGYNSEPESLTRSTEKFNISNPFDRVTQINEVIEKGHLRKLPTLMYYDGVEYYTGPDPELSALNAIRNSKFLNTKPILDIELTSNIERF